MDKGYHKYKEYSSQANTDEENYQNQIEEHKYRQKAMDSSRRNVYTPPPLRVASTPAEWKRCT